MGILHLHTLYGIKCARSTSTIILRTVSLRVYNTRYVGFDVPTAEVINVSIFWNIMLCGLYVNEECVTSNLGLKINNTRNQHAAGG
jgi:hypothetical protein